MTNLPLPEGLTRLLATGIWPSVKANSEGLQHLKPLVAPELVRRFAAGESFIYLQPPPFPTIGHLRAARGAGDFWERFGALAQIVPDQALVIGDFGIGSDSPIILDYARNPENPPVLRLQWGPGTVTAWVQGARDFDEFARMLGLDANTSPNNVTGR